MTSKAKDKPIGLALLREPFPANQISKLPKPTKFQTDAVKDNYKVGRRCTVCGGWHHPDVVHLDYVGHAALTDRLLDADINWDWEPLALTEWGLPLLDQIGGLWIKLTVCGMTRLGYGDADGKKGGNAVKEAIGDALRNASMRFGAALDLWHKGDLHVDEADETTAVDNVQNIADVITDTQFAELTTLGEQCGQDWAGFCKHFAIAAVNKLPAAQFAHARSLLEVKIRKQEKEAA